MDGKQWKTHFTPFYTCKNLGPKLADEGSGYHSLLKAEFRGRTARPQIGSTTFTFIKLSAALIKRMQLQFQIKHIKPSLETTVLGAAGKP
jgi:hypothetical protein